MKSRGPSLRPWVEAIIALILLLVTMAFSLSILDSQAAFSDDRAGLMSLKETWSATAGSYGIRGDARSNSVDFITEYRTFRERPSISRLVKVDPAFATAAQRVDYALFRLESAESLGRMGTQAVVTKAVVTLDKALAFMVGRVAEYSHERLKVARFSLAILLFLIIVIAAAFLFLERRIMLEGIEAAGNRAFAGALISAQEAERLRLSHELHDAVAQDLAAARVYCDLAAREEGSPADANKASSLLERSIGEIREICQGLRPVELDRLGISKACAQLCVETSRMSGLIVGFSTRGFEVLVGRELEALGEDLEINVYRILQEALTNVRRHAQASRVDVVLEVVPTAMRLRVADDGIGLGSARPGGGRRGMEERARMLGGLLAVGPGPEGGTVVSAAIPVAQREGT